MTRGCGIFNANGLETHRRNVGVGYERQGHVKGSQAPARPLTSKWAPTTSFSSGERGRISQRAFPLPTMQSLSRAGELKILVTAISRLSTHVTNKDCKSGAKKSRSVIPRARYGRATDDVVGAFLCAREF